MKKLLLLFFLFSCTHAPQKPIASDLIFPDGTYKQDVEVFVLTPKTQEFDFSCAVKKSPEGFLFHGYNSFGITLFKISQKGSEAPIAESSVEQIKKNEKFFLNVFSLVKEIMALQKTDSRLKGNALSMKVEGLETQVSFSEYDEARVPRKINVETKDKFKVQIETTSYSFPKGTAYLL